MDTEMKSKQPTEICNRLLLKSVGICIRTCQKQKLSLLKNIYFVFLANSRYVELSISRTLF